MNHTFNRILKEGTGVRASVLLIRTLEGRSREFGEHSDPGWPSEWEVSEITISKDDKSIHPVVMTETQFTTIFNEGMDIVTSAIEDAHCEESSQFEAELYDFYPDVV